MKSVNQKAITLMHQLVEEVILLNDSIFFEVLDYFRNSTHHSNKIPPLVEKINQTMHSNNEVYNSIPNTQTPNTNNSNYNNSTTSTTTTTTPTPFQPTLPFQQQFPSTPITTYDTKYNDNFNNNYSNNNNNNNNNNSTHQPPTQPQQLQIATSNNNTDDNNNYTNNYSNDNNSNNYSNNNNSNNYSNNNNSNNYFNNNNYNNYSNNSYYSLFNTNNFNNNYSLFNINDNNSFNFFYNSYNNFDNSKKTNPLTLKQIEQKQKQSLNNIQKRKTATNNESKKKQKEDTSTINNIPNKNESKEEMEEEMPDSKIEFDIVIQNMMSSNKKSESQCKNKLLYIFHLVEMKMFFSSKFSIQKNIWLTNKLKHEINSNHISVRKYISQNINPNFVDEITRNVEKLKIFEIEEFNFTETKIMEKNNSKELIKNCINIDGRSFVFLEPMVKTFVNNVILRKMDFENVLLGAIETEFIDQLNKFSRNQICEVALDIISKTNSNNVPLVKQFSVQNEKFIDIPKILLPTMLGYLDCRLKTKLMMQRHPVIFQALENIMMLLPDFLTVQRMNVDKEKEKPKHIDLSSNLQLLFQLKNIAFVEMHIETELSQTQLFKVEKHYFLDETTKKKKKMKLRIERTITLRGDIWKEIEKNKHFKNRMILLSPNQWGIEYIVILTDAQGNKIIFFPQMKSTTVEYVDQRAVDKFIGDMELLADQLPNMKINKKFARFLFITNGKCNVNIPKFIKGVQVIVLTEEELKEITNVNIAVNLPRQ